MTTNQVKEIITYRKHGSTILAISELVGCDKTSVSRYLDQAGMVRHKPPERNRPIAMIMNDWNASAKSSVLVKKYGFKSIRTLYTTISWYRAHGYRFAFRNRPERSESE